MIHRTAVRCRRCTYLVGHEHLLRDFNTEVGWEVVFQTDNEVWEITRNQW
jgi:hypothetical protein